jgi:hypothetical protein
MRKIFLGLLVLGSGSFIFAQGGSTFSAPQQESMEQGTLLMAELSGSVDAAKAKTGDLITAKVRDKAQDLLPAGATLIGHVIEAHGRSKEDPQSKLSISFDKARLKDGTEKPLNLLVEFFQAPTPPPMAVRPSGDDQLASLNSSMSRAAGPTTDSIGGRTSPPAAAPDRNTGYNASPVQSPLWNQRSRMPEGMAPSGLPDVALAPVKKSSQSFTVLTSSRREVKLPKHVLLYLMVVSDGSQATTK